jgi:hypothetical protein
LLKISLLAGFSVEGENEFTRDQRCGQSQNFGATLESRKVDCCQRAEAKNIRKCAAPKRHEQPSLKIFHKLSTGNTEMNLVAGVLSAAIVVGKFRVAQPSSSLKPWPRRR